MFLLRLYLAAVASVVAAVGLPVLLADRLLPAHPHPVKVLPRMLSPAPLSAPARAFLADFHTPQYVPSWSGLLGPVRVYQDRGLVAVESVETRHGTRVRIELTETGRAALAPLTEE